jgi:hypothetical protein
MDSTGTKARNLPVYIDGDTDVRPRAGKSEGQKCGHGLIFRLLRLGVVDSLRGCAAAAPSFRSEPS